MGHILSTSSTSSSPRGMSPTTCCEHHCCHQECRRRARQRRTKRGDGDAALDELLWAAGDVLKEYAKSFKERRSGGVKKNGGRESCAEREREDPRRLEGGYEGYQLPAEAFEPGEAFQRNHSYGRYRDQGEDDEMLSPMEHPQGSRTQRPKARGTRSRHGPGHRRRPAPPPRSLSQHSFMQPGHPREFGYANVDSFQGPPQQQPPMGRARHNHGSWNGSASNGRGNGGRFSS